ncbi:hypothetical protein D3C73_1409030 [compost metagenome]
MQLVEGVTTKVCQFLQDVGIQQRQTVENTARQLSILNRNGLTGFAACGLDFCAHINWVDKAIVIRVDQELAGR